jgi:hypothetical protein
MKILGGLILSALLLAPVARADTSDQGFSDLVGTQGITSDKWPSALAGLGRQVCSVLMSGKSDSQAARSLEDVMTVDQASFFVGAAKSYYCS